MFDNKYMKHGRNTEKKALSSLFRIVKPKHVFNSGLTVNPLLPFLGATTDIIMVDQKNRLCCGEIKCPASVGAKDRKDKNKTVFDMEYIEGKTLKETSEYYLQVQLQLVLNKCDLCYFYVYGGSDENSLCLEIWRHDKIV